VDGLKNVHVVGIRVSAKKQHLYKYNVLDTSHITEPRRPVNSSQDILKKPTPTRHPQTAENRKGKLLKELEKMKPFLLGTRSNMTGFNKKPQRTRHRWLIPAILPT
jgi:hypothetical protein